MSSVHWLSQPSARSPREREDIGAVLLCEGVLRLPGDGWYARVNRPRTDHAAVTTVIHCVSDWAADRVVNHAVHDPPQVDDVLRGEGTFEEIYDRERADGNFVNVQEVRNSSLQFVGTRLSVAKDRMKLRRYYFLHLDERLTAHPFAVDHSLRNVGGPPSAFAQVG